MNRHARRATAKLSQHGVSKEIAKKILAVEGHIWPQSADATSPEDPIEKVLREIQTATAAKVDKHAPASPGYTTKRITYPDPRTGERITGFRKQPNVILYQGAESCNRRIWEDGMNATVFLQQAKKEDLRLVPRSVRRAEWFALRKTKKAA